MYELKLGTSGERFRTSLYIHYYINGCRVCKKLILIYLTTHVVNVYDTSFRLDLRTFKLFEERGGVITTLPLLNLYPTPQMFLVQYYLVNGGNDRFNGKKFLLLFQAPFSLFWDSSYSVGINFPGIKKNLSITL